MVRDGSSVSLPHDRFYLVFNSVWEEMVMKRELIVDPFAYCGLYPLRNTAKEYEYNKGEAFRNNDEFQLGDVNFPLLKKIIPPPKKVSNPTHTKPYSANITSAENIKKMKEKEEKKRN